MNPWAYLLLAVLSEVIGTTALKLARGFTVLLPSAVVVVGYGTAFYLLSLALNKGMPLSTAYAVWSGLGTALITVLGVWVFKDALNARVLVGIGLIIAGVILLNLTGGSHS